MVCCFVVVAVDDVDVVFTVLKRGSKFQAQDRQSKRDAIFRFQPSIVVVVE